MTQRMDKQNDTTRAARVVPVLVGVATWLVWRLGVQTLVFEPDLASTLLGLSLAANVGLVAYVALSSR